MPITHVLLRGETKEFFNKYLITKILTMRKFTIKSLLITAALCLGTSAWADTGSATVKMTYVDYNNATTAMGEISEGETARSGYNKISGGSVGFAYTKWGCNWITYIQVDASGINGTITGATLTADISGSTDSKRTTTWGVGYNSSVWSADMTYNSADKTITTLGGTQSSSDKSSSAFTTKTFDITAALVNDDDKIVTLLVYETAAAGGYIKNPTVSVEYKAAGAKVANYKVKFVCNGNEIKTAITSSGFVGDPCTIDSELLADFMSDDGNMKYMYVNNDAEGKTIAENGTTVVTVTFREADKYNYTVNAVNAVGEKLKELVTGSNFEGEKSRAYVTKGLNINGDWYITSGNGSYPTYGYDFTEAAIKNVTYTVDENVDYFFEVEDINKSRSWAATGAYPERYSNGKAGRLYKGAYAFTDALAGGVYTITLWARNNSSSAVANVGLYYRDTNGNATPLGVNFADWDKGKSDAKTLENVIIPDGASLMLKNENPDYNSNLEMDYLIFTKTGEATTITDAGYATFSSTYAVDFSESGLTAYTAKVNDGNATITLTPIEGGIVPANTGVILKGEAGNYTGVITTTDATVDNDLKANATKITGGDGSIYVLNNGTKGIGFYQLSETGTLAAGKAYLKITSNAKAYTFVWNESTGIEENYEFGTMNSDAATYDLSGRKVANPAKGLYIKNGKKFIVK